MRMRRRRGVVNLALGEEIPRARLLQTHATCIIVPRGGSETGTFSNLERWHMAGGSTSRADKRRKKNITRRMAKLAQAKAAAASSAKPAAGATPGAAT